MASVKHFLNNAQMQHITETIQLAEQNTTGEIRVRIEAHAKKEILEYAKEVFYQLGMNKTKNKNGVLLFIAVEDKKFAIVGDEAIDRTTPSDYWTQQSEILYSFFKEDQFEKGIITIINNIGVILHQYFPLHEKENIDELSNEISFED